MNRTKVLKIANGLKILYTVLYILCIVGASLALLSGVVMTIMDEEGLLEDTELLKFIGDFSDVADVDFPSLDLMLYGATVSVLGILVLYVLSVRFYKYVCTVGEIFDHTVIKKMQTLGILYLVLPPVVNMIAGAVMSRFTNFHFEITNTPQLTMGIVYLILTVVFSYGADLKEGKTEEDEEAKHPFDEE